MDTVWFKRKRFGWGYTPVTWQGWLLVVVFSLLIFGNAVRLHLFSTETIGTLQPFLIQTVVLVIVLTTICYCTSKRPPLHSGGNN